MEGRCGDLNPTSRLHRPVRCQIPRNVWTLLYVTAATCFEDPFEAYQGFVCSSNQHFLLQIFPNEGALDEEKRVEALSKRIDGRGERGVDGGIARRVHE